jgi:hypothetical protein
MATIPLPALHTEPVAPPPNPLQMYGQLMAIKNAEQELSQRQAMAPIQQEQAQQQVQSGQLDVEAKQRAAANEKAMSATMKEWAGGGSAHGSDGSATGGAPSEAQPAVQQTGAFSNPETGEQLSGGTPLTVKGPSGAGKQGASARTTPSYDDLIPLAIKNGASYSTVQALQAHVLDIKAKASTIAKDDAQAGSARAETMIKNNGMITDAMNGVMSLPDNQLQVGILRAAQELYGKGIFDQQHLQLAQQVAQLAQTDPDAARHQLNVQNISMGAFSKELENAGKQLGNQKAQGEATWRADNNMPAGVTPEEMSLAAYQKANPGKTAADYTVWKAHNSPVMMMNNMANGMAGGPNAPQAPGGGIDWGKIAGHYGMTPTAFDQQAEQAGIGKFPPIGRSANAIAMNRDLMNRYGELHPNASIPQNSAEYKSASASLSKLQTNFSQVQAFEGTADRNLDLLMQVAAKIPDLGTRFANIPLRSINAQMIGTDNMAAFKTILNTSQTETAKVLNSANASGILSDSARHEMQEIIDGNLPFSALGASRNIIKQEFGNRSQAYQDQINFLQNQLKSPGGGGAGAQQQTGNNPFSSFGGSTH